MTPEKWVRRMSLLAVVALALILLTVAVLGSLVLLELREPSQVQGQTVVYITGGEGSQGVPTYVTASESTRQGLLPNFTMVEMICWQDSGGQRWFRVKVLAVSLNQVSAVVVVRSAHTHNQTEVDSC